jgi:hypothetical protein
MMIQRFNRTHTRGKEKRSSEWVFKLLTHISTRKCFTSSILNIGALHNFSSAKNGFCFSKKFEKQLSKR